jgi:hypothetical protein
VAVDQIEAQNNSIKGMLKNYKEINTDAMEQTDTDIANEDINKKKMSMLDDEH